MLSTEVGGTFEAALVQALLKQDQLEQVAQDSVELGFE